MTRISPPGGADAFPSLAVMMSGEGMGFRESIDFAVSLEDAGFDGVWFPEIQRDPFVGLSAVAARTSRIGLGTGVAIWARSPVISALTAANLDQLSEGRFVYGIGTGPPAFNESFHNIRYERPAVRMCEYIEVVRGVWGAHSGQVLDHDGPEYPVHGYTRSISQEREEVPIYLAAVQKGMLRLAGSVADGVLFNTCTTPRYYTQFALPHLQEGAERSGRKLEEIRRASIVSTAVDDDPEQAREWARRHISFYGSLPYFEAIFALHGFEETGAAIRAAAASGDIEGAVRAVTDEVVDTFTVAGTPDHVRRRLREFGGLIETAVLLPPSYLCDEDEIRSSYNAIRESLAPN